MTVYFDYPARRSRIDYDPVPHMPPKSFVRRYDKGAPPSPAPSPPPTSPPPPSPLPPPQLPHRHRQLPRSRRHRL